MRLRRASPSLLLSTLLFALPASVLGDQILSNNGFSVCMKNNDFKVDRMDIQYNKDTSKITFDVSGTSSKSQEVMGMITVTAYGQQVYKKEFDPCDPATKVEQLCPVPAGTFAAKGQQDIPAEYSKMIPAIAFAVPDLDGIAKIEFKARETGEKIGCIQSNVGNGKTMNTVAVPIIAAGIAGAALLVSGLSALAAGGQPGVSGPSPSFFDVITYFQSIAMSGMLSVEYPPMYRSFTKNFAFSGLLIPWDGAQRTIDNFRKNTGGNLTENSVDFLRSNITFVYTKDVSELKKRSLELTHLFARQADSNDTVKATPHFVQGIQGFVEPLIIPKSNTFMTVFLIFAIVIASIIVGILLFKLILELLALSGKLGHTMDGFRKRYWLVMFKTITNLILVLYGVWVLYCMYQFTQGDSWAAKVIAGVSLAIFTAILLYFTFRIWSLARKYKKADGDASALYDNKETWVKYSIFYEHYKKSYWWLFIPVIVYMFARGVIIAVGDGHGMFQVGAQLIVEGLMLGLLIFLRPYTHKSSNWISISIQVVRMVSILCILIFVEQLHVAQTPKTVVGMVLVVLQTVLAVILAILIVVNGIVHLCRSNPHRKARKEAEKARKSRDSLTPLGTRTSLLVAGKNPNVVEDTAYHGSYSDLENTKSNYSSQNSRFEHSRQASEPQSIPLLPTSHYPPQNTQTGYGRGY